MKKKRKRSKRIRRSLARTTNVENLRKVFPGAYAKLPSSYKNDSALEFSTTLTGKLIADGRAHGLSLYEFRGNRWTEHGHL